MKKRELDRLGRHLEKFVEDLLSNIGRPERREALEGYIKGLLLDGDRKSIAPIAARLADSPAEAEAVRQRLQQAVVIAKWPESVMQADLAAKIDAELPGIEALVVDDTGFPKKGKASPGVARQYSGTLGRVDNCQVAVSLHLAGNERSACTAMRLYLSEEWAGDTIRRDKAGIPEEVTHQPKWKISLDQIDAALAAGVRKHCVLADAGYGDCADFREALTKRELPYVVRVTGTSVVWSPQSNPSIPPRPQGFGGKPTTRYRDDEHPPLPIAELAASLAYEQVSWGEDTNRKTSRFAAVRIKTAHGHTRRVPPGAEQWLICEWLDGKNSPNRFWLSTLPPGTSVQTLVRMAKLRWRVERDYQELKQEVGLDHFEGRTWNGFHHHVTLCAVAHCFLALHRALFPPLDSVDAARGATPTSSRATALDWAVSTLPKSCRTGELASSGVLHVIK